MDASMNFLIHRIQIAGVALENIHIGSGCGLALARRPLGNCRNANIEGFFSERSA